VAQDRASELGEEALDEVEPGAVFEREGELEAVRRLSGKPSLGFSGDVRRMVVEDQLDRRTGRVSGVEKLEEFDELSAAGTLLYQDVGLPSEQNDPGQQAERAMALVLMIAREGRVGARNGRQIRRRRCESLDSWLLIVGDDRHRLARFFRLRGGLFQDLNLAIDTQDFRHLLLKFGIATFQIVANLVRFDFFLAKDLAHRALNQLCETFVPSGRSVIARVACQQPRGPQLMRIVDAP